MFKIGLPCPPRQALTLAGAHQVDAGLEALRTALKSGFEQYGKIRNDTNLDNLRQSPKFKPLIDEYDEPVISDGAIK